MSAPRPLTQQAIRQFNSMVNRILMHQDRYRVAHDEVPAITILLEQRGLSKECAEWFTALKAGGNTLAQACEQIGISPDDIALSKTLCMAFLDENLREPLIATLADEVEFIHQFGMVKAYEGLSSASTYHLSTRNLKRDFPAWQVKNKITVLEPIPCRAFEPLEFSLHGNPDQTALRATLQTTALAGHVMSMLRSREYDQVDADTCLRELKRLEAACRLHASLIQKTAADGLAPLPLQGNEPLRRHIMGDAPPSLAELSEKTLDMMRGMASLDSQGEIKRAFNNLVYGALSNPEYFQECFASDLQDTLRGRVEEDDRGMGDEIENGNEKLGGYIHGFQLMREHGVPLDLILLRAACTLSAGKAREALRENPDNAIKYMLKQCEGLVLTTPLRDVASVTAQYLLAGILSHDTQAILQAIGPHEQYARMLYDVTGDRRLLHAVHSEKMKEEILTVDMGL
ncbi:hypothetical protein RBE51_20480 [Pseudomonas taiwanensis]|uniref:hypothetical protein n=1 Tax=Pseudomonas taiwanensis TaxID=470150 RepID=UPI0028DE4AF6|nr:hypothetical protein [Pseudomonas taiwanensis]MDT8925172.1 hypothetical protein [Pseudomonas taiwanensis]